ncbi:ubiquinol oxidase subunit II [Octadecabacter sp.]|nr:ubiquinol oxidase subunit II [Octadecabacter sp.]
MRKQHLWLGLLLLLLPGCDLVVFNAAGDVAAQQGDLIIYSTVLMLIVILPVIALTIFFAFAYRSSKGAAYEPDWDHSVSLEIVIWAVPLAIIIMLAGLTWVATHRLDPYSDLPRISETKPIDPDVEPLTIQVVAMDWKWLFIIPEYGVASINEVAAITDRPVEWKLTSTTVMNAFYLPDMSGMIYAMAGMETELNGVMNTDGTYRGFASHYNGTGFSKMDFQFQSLDQAGFDAWIAAVRESSNALDRDAFVQLDQPSINDEVAYYGTVADGLWNRILNMCVGDDELCMDDMMMVDALGGGGVEGLYNRELYRGICSAEDPRALFAILRPDLIDRAAEIQDVAMSLLPPQQSLISDVKEN